MSIQHSIRAILIFGTTITILASCGQDDVAIVSPTSTGTTTPEYTLEELETLFAREAAKPFYINSGTTADLASYLQGGERNIPELIASITGSDSGSVEKRAYLKSYIGDYSGALAERDTLCKSDATQCPRYGITLEIAPTQDQSGETISEPTIYLDGQPLVVESSIVQPETYDNMVHRVRIAKEGYLDAYDKLGGAESGIREFSLNPVMAKADATVEMDNQVGGTYTAGIGTGAITYTIAPNTFTDAAGKVVQGTVQVYLFALSKADNSLSAFQLDVFSASGANIGSRMITDGMPFLIAYQNGVTLSITKPIAGTGTIDARKIEEGLKSVPKDAWLSPSQLREYGLPGFWRLNRDSGVWEDSVVQILDESGAYKFNFQ